jgi:hypothetical protein
MSLKKMQAVMTHDERNEVNLNETESGLNDERREIAQEYFLDIGSSVATSLVLLLLFIIFFFVCLLKCTRWTHYSPVVIITPP